MLTYKNNIKHDTKRIKLNAKSSKSNANISPNVSFIGGGNYASKILIPAFKKTNINFKSIITTSGVGSSFLGKKFNFDLASTDASDALGSETNAVVIATRHDSHAEHVEMALKNNKHVFVEKPLAITLESLNKIQNTYSESPNILMVGFNRRFSPLIKIVKSLLDNEACPKTFVMNINAGNIPSDHWTQDLNQGGGRVIGEVCHFIDLLRYLTGHEIISYSATKIGKNSFYETLDDKSTITLTFGDGSIGTIHYFANGNKSVPKERIEIGCNGKNLFLDNFKSLKGYGWNSFRKKDLFFQDKGQDACAKAFIDAIIQGQESPIDINEIFEVAKVTIEIGNELRK